MTVPIIEKKPEVIDLLQAILVAIERFHLDPSEGHPSKGLMRQALAIDFSVGVMEKRLERTLRSVQALNAELAEIKHVMTAIDSKLDKMAGANDHFFQSVEEALSNDDPLGVGDVVRPIDGHLSTIEDDIDSIERTVDAAPIPGIYDTVRDIENSVRHERY